MRPAEFTFALDRPPAPAELGDLRASVGWARNDGDYPAAFARYSVVVCARDPAGRLIGFAAIVSDGVRHGFLIDVIVMPEFQRHGVGRALVEKAVARARELGLTILHVDFVPEHVDFYRACGFRIGVAGILELSEP